MKHDEGKSIPAFLVETAAALFGNAEELRAASARYLRLMACYRCAMMEIETKLNELIEYYL